MLRIHEYLRDMLVIKYEECVCSCMMRTQLTCIVCSFCWNCHWKNDKLFGCKQNLSAESSLDILRGEDRAVLKLTSNDRKLFPTSISKSSGYLGNSSVGPKESPDSSSHSYPKLELTAIRFQLAV
jgi:hypothetical protein